jgi:phosphoribosylanthranilate isomerase
MFRIKICGITDVDDAIGALEAGADAYGLNFYKKSPRCVTEKIAHSIDKATVDFSLDLNRRKSHPAKLIYPVGVFVNHAAEYVCRIVRDAGLVIAQLHGDEEPEFFEFLPNMCTVRVIRFLNQAGPAIAENLARCRSAAAKAGGLLFDSPCAVMIDAAQPGHYGGTGANVPWTALANHREWLGDTPLILAGGLTPDNVAEAIRIVRPAAVDVASGVESAPGKKDPIKVRDFIQAARAAFGE